MSVEAVTPPVMPIPLAGGLKICFLAASIETLTSLPTGETCDCGKCPKPIPHITIVLTHETGVPYFAALPKAAAIKVAREILRDAEALPDPKAEPEVEERRK